MYSYADTNNNAGGDADNAGRDADTDSDTDAHSDAYLDACSDANGTGGNLDRDTNPNPDQHGK